MRLKSPLCSISGSRRIPGWKSQLSHIQSYDPTVKEHCVLIIIQNPTKYKHTVAKDDFCKLSFSLCVSLSPLNIIFTYLVNLWLFIAVRNSLTISGLWCLHGVFDMYFNVYGKKGKSKRKTNSSE